VSQILDGFWLPKKLRREIITPETPWVIQNYQAGRPTEKAGPGIASARWPQISRGQWEKLLCLLNEQRRIAPADFLSRIQQALTQISQRFNDPTDSLAQTALQAIPAYTGYAPEMIRFVLSALDLMPLDTLGEIVDLQLPETVKDQYLSLRDLGNLDGRIKFYETGKRNLLKRWVPKSAEKPFPVEPAYPDMVLGFAAGNVIGTSHLISLLAQVSALIHLNHDPGEKSFPVILVKNSRQEPIFAPLIFSALEEIDPTLTESIALMIWDYEDIELQETLLSQADLVIAAAVDFTIDQIEQTIRRVQTPAHPIRFHRHGHKVSFTTIGKSYLHKNRQIPGHNDLEIIHLTTLLAAVDSIFWDQYGCLSSRVHFVEGGDTSTHTALEYANFLAEKIRILSTFLPRGRIPLHGFHNRFEKYASMTVSGQVHLCSTYDDDFLVVVDQRPWSPSIFQSVVNDCIERSIVVRPIADIHEVPDRYLGWLPSENLQTMSVAIDGPEATTWSSRFTQFIEATGKRGVTGVRTLGRGPFPQLAYSWDGYLPIDLSIERPPGYFTTAEFENTFQQIVDTYQLYISLGVSEHPENKKTG
jgi:hypothetical protein